MTGLLQIQEQLLDATARIADAEKRLGERQSRALQSSLKSLYGLRSQLEQEFQEVARKAHVDVLSYRLFEGGERPTMSLVGKALDSFQSLYALLYDVVSSGQPKDRGKLGAAAVRESTFEFSHAFSGSVGFVFTVPNERLLLGETDLDKAMEELFLITRASSIEQVKAHSKRLGLAPVRAVYTWASTLGNSGVGVDIQWSKSAAIKHAAIYQPAEVRALRDLIDLTSESEVDENEMRGSLVGYDSVSRKFRFEPLGDYLIAGTIPSDAEVPYEVTIPGQYSATVKTTSVTHYATEQTEIGHQLLKLVKLP